MEMMLLAIGEKIGVVSTPKADRPAAVAAAPAVDAKAKRLAALEKAREAKKAKAAAAAPAKPAAAKQEAPAAKPAASPAAKGRKVARFKGNGQEVEVHSDDKGYAVLHAVVNGVPVKLGAPVRLSSWRVLCCVIRSAAVQDMDKFMVENGLCDRDLA
jgi:hypothetical protein